jgi:hypothetical protein
MADSKSHASSRSRAVLGGKGKSKSKGGKKPHHLSIRHGKNGGHIVTHHFAPDADGATPPDEENVLPDKAALMQHIDQNVDDNPAPPPTPEPTAPAAAGPAPQAGAGAPPPPGM